MTHQTKNEIHNSLIQGEQTPVEIIEEYLKRIEAQESEMHTFIEVTGESCLNEAKQVPKPITKEIVEDTPFVGIPVGIKDNINVKGFKTTAASKILENHISVYDATVVRKIKNAGGLIIGKTNMDEFAMGSSTETSCFYPTKNPINTKYTPGGSSGGSAASVRAGHCTVSLGSDTGGSVRQPASFCGVVGIRPTYGLVSRYGMLSFCSSLDQIGTIANDVDDAFSLLEVISGYDPKDSTSVNIEYQDLKEPEEISTFGICNEIEKLYIDPFVHDMYKKVIAILLKNFKKENHWLDNLDKAMAAYHIIADSEASSNLARYDGVRYGLQISGESSQEAYIKTRTQGFGAEVKRRILLGTYILSEEIEGSYYKQALCAKEKITEKLDQIFSSCQFMVIPTSLKLPFKFGERNDPLDMYYSDYLTIPSAIAGMPSVTIPVGCNENGFSAGIQIMGPKFSEKVLHSVAKLIEGELK
ncbi:MAG: Asp-tRNA(Asn)/Glu-tRNA(Gln) amidotransferase subunit GatA [Caldisericia bacterium]|nr:Asp-tRNA(Asn)/Glu-tRNA(Gln) amidotransferase subunit GatA [Caldisericia bacterium]